MIVAHAKTKDTIHFFQVATLAGLYDALNARLTVDDASAVVTYTDVPTGETTQERYTRPLYYVCFNDNPLAYGQWAHDSVEIIEVCPTRDSADTRRAELQRSYRLLSGGYGYYQVLDHPPVQDWELEELQPFDPGYAGERMDDDY